MNEHMFLQLYLKKLKKNKIRTNYARDKKSMETPRPTHMTFLPLTLSLIYPKPLPSFIRQRFLLLLRPPIRQCSARRWPMTNHGGAPSERRRRRGRKCSGGTRSSVTPHRTIWRRFLPWRCGSEPFISTQGWFSSRFSSSLSAKHSCSFLSHITLPLNEVKKEAPLMLCYVMLSQAYRFASCVDADSYWWK